MGETEEIDMILFEEFFELMKDPIKREEFSVYIGNIWDTVWEKYEQKYEPCTEFRLLYYFFGNTKDLDITSYIKNVIEFPKILLSYVKYIFSINDNYTRFIFP